MNDAERSLRSLLSGAYGITATTIADAPRGFVANTYDVTAEDGRRYFAKQLPLWADARAVRCGVAVLGRLDRVLGLRLFAGNRSGLPLFRLKPCRSDVRRGGEYRRK